MVIKKGNNIINSIKDWEDKAPPKDKKKQWVPERSAFELANVWVGTDKVVIPSKFSKIIQSVPVFKNIILIEGEPEAQLRFDNRKGEPRNADLAIKGKVNEETVAITIEAKADEAFGEILHNATINALERKLENYKSQGVERIIDLLKSILPSQTKSLPKLDKIRYQLLTGVAGTIAYANSIKSKYAIFIVHEFHTSKTSLKKIEANSLDLENFMKRLSNSFITSIVPGKLYGPFSIPGLPLFKDIPDLYIGKIID